MTKDFRAEALHQIHGPERWLQKTEDGGHGTAKRRPLDSKIRTEEILMMGLRLKEGISRDRFATITGVDLDQAIDKDGLGRMVAGGFVEADEKGLRVTKAGRLCLNDAGMSANLCVESHLRELLEQGFEVAVVTDATAAAQAPGLDGYAAALVNFRFLANTLWTTSEATSAMEAIGKSGE